MKRIIVGISGASGSIYAIRLLEILRAVPDVETHLVMTKSGQTTLGYETPYRVEEVRALADVCYQNGDVGAAIASGSFRTGGMVVAPCSVRTLAAIAGCVSDTLLTRAADVVLKERRRLVLMFRETPLHAGHIAAMAQATAAGAVIAPPVPAFYARPESIEAMVDHSVGRVLDLFGIETPIHRWAGTREADPAGRVDHRG